MIVYELAFIVDNRFDCTDSFLVCFIRVLGVELNLLFAIFVQGCDMDLCDVNGRSSDNSELKFQVHSLFHRMYLHDGIVHLASLQ